MVSSNLHNRNGLMNWNNLWSANRFGPWTFRREAGKKSTRMDWSWFIRPFTGRR